MTDKDIVLERKFNIPDDLYKTFDHQRDNFIDLVIKAQKRAITEGIQANSIIINKNMVKVPDFWMKTPTGGAIQLPPMICGLNVYMTDDELPHMYSFAIFEGPETRLQQFESIGMSPAELRKAAEVYRVINETLGSF